MKPNSRKARPLVPIEKRPEEWDFRWVGSEAEAGHLLVLEQAREALRQADMRLTTTREKKALRRLVMAMTIWGWTNSSDRERKAVEGLSCSAFISGVIIDYAGAEELALNGLPTGFEVRHLIRRISKPDPDAEAKVRIDVLRKGVPVEPSSFSRDSWLLVKVPPGFTARKATAQFSEWAKVNLPAEKKLKGGRPELPSLGLQRLAFYRFDQAWEGPRAYAGFAVSVRGGASDVVRPEFTEFGNRMYAPFMNPKANQPKAATWSESVSIVRKELAPIVAELVDVVKSIS
jgi:hypothetical protein